MIDTHDPLTFLRDFARIQRTDRTAFYNGLIDDAMEKWLALLDLKQLPWAETDHRSQIQHQRGARGATNLTGMLAFVWANPMSRFHRDERLLTHVRARLRGFADLQHEGSIRWRNPERSGHFPEHDPDRNALHIAWHIEPLVMAANWIRDELDEEEHNIVHRMARRTADLLMALPCHERNNRGAVSCAVLSLLGRFLNDRTLIDTAVAYFHGEPMGIFNRDGQINEGMGPDAHYSGTSYIYCYTYRIFSGDVTVDPGLRRGVRWYSWVADSFGAPACFGASTRIAITGADKVVDYLPAMERYAGEDPSFHALIDQGYRRGLAQGWIGHVVSPFIYAMFEHNGRNADGVDAAWFTPASLPRYKSEAGPEFRFDDEGTDSFYMVLRGRDHHATTTLIGRAAYKGLQHWNYRLEPPVFWPTESHASRTLAWGIDTSRMRVEGTKFNDVSWREGRDGLPHLLITRVSQVMHHYLLTPVTLLYLVSSPLAPREDRFVIDTARCGQPIVDDTGVHYAGREGRLHVPAGGRPEVITRANGLELCWQARGRTSLYAFSDASFKVDDFTADADALTFTDASGRYRLNYELRFFSDDDLAPIGNKGLGELFLSQKVHANVERL